MNHAIRASKVLLILGNHNLGEQSLSDALDLARQKRLDLVQVNPGKKGVPVCRIIDYGKHQYEQGKKTKQSKQKGTEWKEIRLTPGIGDHDIGVKVNQIRRFLEQGKYVKLSVRYKRRQIIHVEEGRKIMETILKAVEDIGKSESRPRLEGKQLTAQITPK